MYAPCSSATLLSAYKITRCHKLQYRNPKGCRRFVQTHITVYRSKKREICNEISGDQLRQYEIVFCVSETISITIIRVLCETCRRHSTKRWILTLLVAREHFIPYRRHESLKSCIIIYLRVPMVLQTKGMVSVFRY
jgi:hypothetical protein